MKAKAFIRVFELRPNIADCCRRSMLVSMHKIFVDFIPEISVEYKITGADFHHIKNVLRMHIGDELSLLNNIDETKEYRCGIERFDSDSCIVALRFIKDSCFELPSKLYLFQCLPKGDKLDFVIQKAVELGVHAIILVQSGRCIVKVPPEKIVKKLARYNKIAESAARQCGRNIIPKVLGIMDFRQALHFSKTLNKQFIPYEMETDFTFTRQYFSDIKKGESVGFFIGPEGGFATDEIALAKEYGITPVSLGRRILRTETAGMAVLSILGYLLE